MTANHFNPSAVYSLALRPITDGSYTFGFSRACSEFVTERRKSARPSFPPALKRQATVRLSNLPQRKSDGHSTWTNPSGVCALYLDRGSYDDPGSVRCIASPQHILPRPQAGTRFPTAVEFSRGLTSGRRGVSLLATSRPAIEGNMKFKHNVVEFFSRDLPPVTVIHRGNTIDTLCGLVDQTLAGYGMKITDNQAIERVLLDTYRRQR